MEKYFDLLCRTPLFAGMDIADLSSILNCLDAKTAAVRKGEPLFLEGAPAGFVGIVLQGCIQIVREDYFGNRSVLTQAVQGDIFAETFSCAGVDEMPVSAFALQDSTVMLLSCRKMLTVCGSACACHSLLIRNLLQIMAQKNLQLNRKIRYMSRKTTKEKLMAFLLDQAKQQGSAEFTIPFDRQALADFLGVERSAMSAELGKLRKAGILECRGSRFRLLDQE